jgi:hypothetical protein
MLENGYARYQKCHFQFLDTVCASGVTHEGCTLRVNKYMWYHVICTKYHENLSAGWKFAMGTDKEGERNRQRCTHVRTHTQRIAISYV